MATRVRKATADIFIRLLLGPRLLRGDEEREEEEEILNPR